MFTGPIPHPIRAIAVRNATYDNSVHIPCRPGHLEGLLQFFWITFAIHNIHFLRPATVQTVDNIVGRVIAEAFRSLFDRGFGIVDFQIY